MSLEFNHNNEHIKHEYDWFPHMLHHTLILHLLHVLTRSNNVWIANVSFCTLTNLFVPSEPHQPDNPVFAAQSKAVQAYQKLDLPTKQYLYAYCTLNNKKHRQTSHPHHRVELDGKHIWHIHTALPHDTWLCQLTKYLIRKYVVDAVMKQVLNVCVLVPEFASRILPYVLCDILFQERVEYDTYLHQSINQCIHTAIELQPHSSQHWSIVPFLTTLLNALAYLYRQQTIVSRMLVNDRNSRDMRVHLDRKQHMEEHFFKHLNLLQLAECAHHGSMYATSMVYLEQWHERVYGAVYMSHDGNVCDANVSAAELSLYTRLLLLNARHIPDPDQLYGVMTHTQQQQYMSGKYHMNAMDVEHDLLLSEHENHAEHTLEIYDSLYQNQNRFGAAAVHSLFTNTHINLHAGIASSLHALGCAHVQSAYLAHMAHAEPHVYTQIQESHYEAAWRTCQWNMHTQPIHTTVDTHVAAHTGLQHNIYHSLHSLYEYSQSNAHEEAFRDYLDRGRMGILHILGSAQPQNPSVFHTFTQLHVLADIEHAWQLCESRTTPSQQQLSIAGNYTRDSQSRLALFSHDFKLVEPILAIQGIILHMLGVSSLVSAHLQFSTAFARHGCAPVHALQFIRCGLVHPHLASVHKLQLRMEECRLNWEDEQQSEHAIRNAKHIVRELAHIVGKLTGSHSASAGSSSPIPMSENMHTHDHTSMDVLNTQQAYIHASCLLGEWLSRSHAEGVSVIRQYLEAAEQCAAHNTTLAQSVYHHGTYYHLATFYDRMYEALSLKSQSVDHTHHVRQLQSNAIKLKELEVAVTEPKFESILKDKMHKKHAEAVAKKVFTLKFGKEHRMYQQQQDQFHKQQADCLQQAIHNYVLALTAGDIYDTQCIYRFIALWFKHYALTPYTADKIHVLQTLTHVPTYKFLPLVYQIASRLNLSEVHGISHPESLFRKNIHELLRRMIEEHPYHSLYQLFALSHGDETSVVHGNIRGASESNTDRIQAAKNMIAELSRTSTHVATLVQAQEKLIRAYMDLAVQSRATHKSQRRIGAPPMLDEATKYATILPVPTLTIPIRTNADYQHIMYSWRTQRTNSNTHRALSITSSTASIGLEDKLITIQSFQKDIYFTPSGVNRPLIIDILCSDGRIHKQLLKTADDLRQDAVMEQLFQVVNGVLDRSGTASDRHLHIRTYNVVPLSPGIGLVEWVQNTQSLADILVDDRLGVHTRYSKPGKQVVGYSEAMNKLKAIQENSKSVEELRSEYVSLCAQFPPCFHKFFLESYPHPQEWFNRRIEYTRSTAVNCIVGDRHIHNILLDVQTAQLIHIDLGVAFDMGLVLKTPEIVPFRLTRDVIDGMGVLGYEGVFRRCAETTLHVLRENKDRILTVLEVFVFDPLYKLRPEELGDANANTHHALDGDMKEADTPNTTGNTNAQRAIMNVSQRLSGVEQRDVLSVAGQVHAWIHQATDVDNLMKMYYGWSAIV